MTEDDVKRRLTQVTTAISRRLKRITTPSVRAKAFVVGGALVFDVAIWTTLPVVAGCLLGLEILAYGLFFVDVDEPVRRRRFR